MSQQEQSTGRGWGSPVVVLPALLLVAAGPTLVAIVTALFGNLVLPISMIGGFAYRVAPLTPALEAIILAFGLWWCAGVGLGQSALAAVLMLVLRLVVAYLFAYQTSLVTPILPDWLVTLSLFFLAPLFLQSVLSGASVLLILAFYAASFRSVMSWIVVIGIWSLGTTLLFWLYHGKLITLDIYPHLAQLVRVLGFVAAGYYFQQPARARRAA